jgi:uncharacterized protein (DUF983 family)
VPKLELPTAIATGIAFDTWFSVICPHCGEETLVSLYTAEDAMCDCDACPGQFWFHAGAFAGQRLSD